MQEPESNVRSVERALDILDSFMPGNYEQSLTEIARAIGLPISTTSRIVGTLEARGYVARSPDNGRYSLGPRIALLGAFDIANLDLRKIALPFMQELNLLYDEGVSLYVPQGDERVCIERVESHQALRRVINIGDRHSLTRGAAGRVLLAYTTSEAKRAELLAGDPFASEASLQELRNEGYAVSLGEREEGVSSISAPIRDARGKVIAALALSGPSVRFEGPLDDRVVSVKMFAEKISKALGAEKF